MNAKDIAARYQEQIRTELEAVVPAQGPAASLYRMLRYHLGWMDAEGWACALPAGKQIRPVLCLLACGALGGDPRAALPAAAAVELVHNFSLIHDDIQDQSTERRHRATVWRLWGIPQAITAGDAMYALARGALLRLAERGVPPNRVLQAAAILDDACLRLCEGQYLDLAYEACHGVTMEDYLAMIKGKTAALVACSTELGALVATDELEAVEALRVFGESLGLAYQIQDDVLGIWGDPAVTGKPAADDIRRRKKTWPVVYALSNCQRPAAARRLRELLCQEPDDATVAETLALLEKAQVRYAAEAAASALHETAIHQLDKLNLHNRHAQGLRLLARSLLGRVD